MGIYHSVMFLQKLPHRDQSRRTLAVIASSGRRAAGSGRPAPVSLWELPE